MAHHHPRDADSVPGAGDCRSGARGADRHHRRREHIHVKVFTPLTSLVNIFVLPLMAIVPALLYLKMRQFGGETLNDVMAQLESKDTVRSNWQQRMRTRLTINT